MNNKEKEQDAEERFLALVSHRVRTPLNSVIGFSKLLMSGDVSAERTQEFAERIMDSGYQILQYFQNMIDLSEVESGCIHVKPAKVNINRLLADVTEAYKGRIEQDQYIDLYLMNNNQATTVYSDEYVVERVISNVIELARSYINEGLVTIEYETNKDNRIAIEIRGIRSNELEEKNEQRDADQNDYDYFSWKAVNKLLDLIQGRVTHRSDSHEVVYTIVIPGECQAW